MLRKVPLEAIVTEALRRMNEYSQLPRGWDEIVRSAPRRPGGAGRDDRFYATWAKRYVDADPRKRIKDLAETYSQKYGAVTQFIFDARERGLLSREGQGKSGGVLTPKALAILRKEKRTQ
jgi:hypothetical protein